MLSEPKLDEIINGARGMKVGIKKCMESECLVSAVTLIYSSIDAMAALYRDNPTDETNRNLFIEWSNKYLLPELSGYEISGVDLYSSRCSLVHKYSMDSKLSISRKAKRIIYVWDEFPFVGIKLKIDDVMMSVNDLHSAYSVGINQFVEDVAFSEPAFSEKIINNLEGMFLYKPYGNAQVLVA